MTPSRNPGRDGDEPTPERLEELNSQFYSAEPWTYFKLRLAHLMLVAGDTDRYRRLLADGVNLGSLELKLEHSAAEAPDVPTVEQTFAAIEAEVLLHHAAETLMRFVHAHSERDPCPWLRMSRVRNFGDFKDWVRSTVATAGVAELDQLCVDTLACDPAEPTDVRACADHLRLLGRHFLDADSYNAAKHGMALRGGAEQWTVKVEEWELLDRGGATVSWLARWPRDDPDRLARWTRASRVLSLEACAALIQVATQLMRALWLRGRERLLGEGVTQVFRPVDPGELFAAFDLRHPVIADFFRPLPEGGESEEVIIRSRHFEAPPDGDADASPPA